MQKYNKSRVISFKLMPSELYLWKEYAMRIGKTPSSFLISKVNRYLSLNPLKEEFDSENILKMIKKSRKYKALLKIEGVFGDNGIKGVENLKEKDLVLLKNVSLRLELIALEEWDSYRKERFFSRTALIRQTLNSFFNSQNNNLIEFEGNSRNRLSLVINSLICEVGSIDFKRLKAIFGNKVDSPTLIQVLDKLEEEGTITRKGSWDNYIPTNPPENRGGSLMLGELLTRFI